MQREPGPPKQFFQPVAAVSRNMSDPLIVQTPQPGMRWNGDKQEAPGVQHASHLAEYRLGIRQMLQDVKQPHALKDIGAEWKAPYVR